MGIGGEDVNSDDCAFDQAGEFGNVVMGIGFSFKLFFVFPVNYWD